ncbi:sigma factor-like helix-turn-helix DNA-binding protein [Micromonospora haikouensis]|uniref:sigma factor-like helix-turn-helix DNA-binding protein n=1 Tax=Micromonospora haikouensis TaxID=686309 RepID=UPI00342121AE
MDAEGIDARELARLVRGLPAMPAAKRAKLARELVDVAKRVLSLTADAAVLEALESMTYRELAAELGTSEASVNKAVSRHRSRMGERRQS